MSKRSRMSADPKIGSYVGGRISLAQSEIFLIRCPPLVAPTHPVLLSYSLSVILQHSQGSARY
jgi:hypothetical protein